MYNKRKTEEYSVDYIPQGVSKKDYSESKQRWEHIYDFCGSVITAIIIIFIIFTFLFRGVNVIGDSMNNTLMDNDWLIISQKTSYERGDIVIITQPNAFNEPIVKRIIAKGGDTINIDFINHTVTVNGEVLKESYIKEPTARSFIGVDFPLTVPQGKVFVMGDNRNNSVDSRSPKIGLIDERYILGKATARIFPFSEFEFFSF